MEIRTSRTLVFICVFCTSVLGNPVQIPSNFKICYRDDPNLNKCLKKSIKYFIPHFPEGIPELNVDSLDPWFSSHSHFEYKRNQIEVQSDLHNVTVSGMSAAKIRDVRADLEDDSMVLEIDLTSKKLFAEGSYDAKGRFNAFALTNGGYFNCTLYNTIWTWRLKGSSYIKNDKKYMKITSFFVSLDIGDIDFHMTDIVPGNPAINEIIREFIKTSWRLLYAEILPFAEASWDKHGRRISNRVFGKIPYDELFPLEPDNPEEVYATTEILDVSEE